MFSQPYKCTLSPELLKKAQEELREDPNTRHLEIKTLRERLKKLPGYRGRTDDGFLLRFLRAKKFDQERAFKQVKTFYEIQRDNPDIFDNLTPKRVLNVLECSTMGVLKDRAPDGSCVILFQVGTWDPDVAPLLDMMAANFLTMCKLIEDEATQVCGVTMIADLKDMGWNHIKGYSPSIASKESTLYQEAFPVRFKGIHYVNEPKFFDAVFAISKPFLKEKMLKRVHMHGNRLERLQEYFPSKMLPEQLGGTGPECSTKEWVTTMLACEEQFARENKFAILDMTIPGKEQKKADATESLGGTFRKLNVD